MFSEGVCGTQPFSIRAEDGIQSQTLDCVSNHPSAGYYAEIIVCENQQRYTRCTTNLYTSSAIIIQLIMFPFVSRLLQFAFRKERGRGADREEQGKTEKRE